MIILNPDKIHELNLGENAWQAIKTELEKFRHTDWHWFARIAATIKFLFPDKASEINLDNTAKQAMQNQLEEHRAKENTMRFLSMLFDIKVLLAEKMGITENGIKLTMPHAEKYQEAKTAMPVRKKF